MIVCHPEKECIQSLTLLYSSKLTSLELPVGLTLSSPMCVTEAGSSSEVSFELPNARSPMCVTEAGRWSEAGFELKNAIIFVLRCERQGGRLSIPARVICTLITPPRSLSCSHVTRNAPHLHVGATVRTCVHLLGARPTRAGVPAWKCHVRLCSVEAHDACCLSAK